MGFVCDWYVNADVSGCPLYTENIMPSPKAYHAELIFRCLVLNALENTICVKALIC